MRRFNFFSAFLLLVALTPALAELPAEQQFAQASRALSGDEQAIEALLDRVDETPFNHWVLAAAHQRQGSTDQAVGHYRQAFEHGEIEAALALAQLYFDAGRHLDATIWSQVWILHHFDPTDIRRGEANKDHGVFLMRQTLEELNEQETSRAELQANRILAEWTPESTDPEASGPRFCLEPSPDCDKWAIDFRSAPSYPRNKAMQREFGWVRAYALSDSSGEVKDVVSLISSDRAFRRNAERALKRWRLQPPPDNSEAITFVQTIFFTLD